MKRLLTKFDNSIPLAAAAYNAGPHRVENWLANFGDLQVDEFIEHIPFVETRNYVKKVSRNFLVYSKLYGNKKELEPWLTKSIHVQITRPSSRETWEAL